jgi:hypothetical protein
MGIDALAASVFGGGDILGSLGSLFGIGDAAAAGTGAATIGAADAGAAAGAGGLADLVGTGTGLAGGATGLAGTELAGGVSAADIASGVAFGGGATAAGGGALGTALDFLSAPAASGFDSAALTPGIGAAGGGPGVLGASPVTTPTGAGSTSVFDTGTSGISGVNSAGAPAATTGVTTPGAGAASVAAPSGVSGVPDATAAASGTTPATGAAGTAGASGTTPATGAAGTAGASAPTSSIESLLGKAGTGALNSLTNNPLGTALGAGGLGFSVFEGLQQTANEKALTATANTANANSSALESQGQGLVNFLTSGTLPPAYQTQINQSIQSAITAAKSNAAAQGLSADPTQNAALATQIQEIQNQAPILQEQIAAQLAGTGTSLINAGAGAAGLSGQLFGTLVQNDTTQAANAGKAISTLAAALNGKSTNTIGQTTISTG